MQQIPQIIDIDNTIRILPDFIANQIAAGEVVQRPESVIKELVENSIDAGADTIVVLVKDAGKQIIHVVDNGKGMSREDIALSVRRHATSKIYSSEDLDAIRTFGFRGEALASITSVANIEIRSKRQQDESGWKLISEPMKPEIIEPMSLDNGTQVFVRNLFFNVPARRKFLKSNLTEFRYISDTMIRFALSNTNIRFTFYDNDSLIFDLKPQHITERISVLLGRNYNDNLIPISDSNDFIQLTGYIGQPHLAKQSKSNQYLFLNGRSIVSKSLSHAVFAAYEHLLEKAANPFFLINLKTDPSRFDVNVHPQKHEVKFEEERLVYSFINRAITKALQENNLAPEAIINLNQSQSPFERFGFSGNTDSRPIMVNTLTGEVIEPSINVQNQNYFRGGNFSNHSYQNARSYNNEGYEKEITAYDAIFGNKSGNLEPIPNENINYDTELPKGEQFYWQLHKKYIFTQTNKGLMIIDQHAAHERVLYEKAIKAMNKHFAYSQELLFPAVVDFNPSEMALIIGLVDDLQNLGYHFNIIDNNKIELTGVPLDTINGNEISSFKEIIDLYDEYQKVRHTNTRDNLAASYSCKSAIKTGQPLSLDEMKKLINDLFLCEYPYACPHGRPVIIEFPLLEFDKRFGRLG